MSRELSPELSPERQRLNRWVRFAAVIALCCAALSQPLSQQAWSASSILFNGSPAYDCYRATLQREVSDMDLEPCTLALESQSLDKNALAATYSNRGIILARLGEFSDALKDHNRAVGLDTGFSSIYINRASALMRIRRFQEAMADLDIAVAIADNQLAVAHYNRSLLFHQLGDLPSARSEAEKAAELSPESIAYRAYFESLTAALKGAAETQDKKNRQ